MIKHIPASEYELTPYKGGQLLKAKSPGARMFYELYSYSSWCQSIEDDVFLELGVWIEEKRYATSKVAGTWRYAMFWSLKYQTHLMAPEGVFKELEELK